MKIDKENNMVIFDDLEEIKMMAESLRHCHKQAVWEGEWADMCYEYYDELFEAFIRKKGVDTSQEKGEGKK